MTVFSDLMTELLELRVSVKSLGEKLEAKLPAIPDGWQLVPKVPTREMLAEVWYNDEHDIDSTVRLKTAYHMMLAAAPEPNK